MAFAAMKVAADAADTPRGPLKFLIVSFKISKPSLAHLANQPEPWLETSVRSETNDCSSSFEKEFLNTPIADPGFDLKR